jgi:uncharacterized protein with PQ loop repeat
MKKTLEWLWPSLASLLFWVGEWQQMYVILSRRSAQDVSTGFWVLVTTALIGWLAYYAYFTEGRARTGLLWASAISILNCAAVTVLTIIF